MNKKIINNIGSIYKINKSLFKDKKQSILIIAGKKSFSKSGAKKKLSFFLNNYKHKIFYKCAKQPTFEECLKGAIICRIFNPTLIIAIGGGSVIDTGKIINAFCKNQNKEIDLVKNRKKLTHKLKKFIAVPTTCGSGSEATNFAVVYVGDKKYSLESTFIKPNFVILDSFFLTKLPKYETASSIFDSLSQSIESYWSKNSTPTSRKFAKKAIIIITKNIQKCLTSNSKKYKQQMLIAAHLAGKAINISKTTGAHAISYGISIYAGVSHGHAVALTLGKFFILNQLLLTRNKKYSVFAKRLNEIYKLLEVKSSDEAHDYWYSLMKKCGLSTDLKTLGIYNKKLINKIIDSVNLQRLSNHPVNIKRVHLSYLFEK